MKPTDGLPPSNTRKVNLSDHLAVELTRGYEVFEWHPVPDAKGDPTEVHLVLSGSLPDGKTAFFALRLKSRRAVDELIGVLERHRDGVFGRGT